MNDISPTARALLCLQVLLERPGISSAQLADRLGVSERAVRRYVSILRDADIPIESERGRYGGYRVGRGVRLPPLMFSATEALGLVMAVLDGHHDPDDHTDPVGTALGKLLATLPAPVSAQAEVVRRTTAPVPDRSASRPEPDITATLVQACSEHRRVRLTYRSENRPDPWELEVDPWAVVVRHGRWYLLCWSHHADDRRAFRVDRVCAAAPLASGFTPPTGLDAIRELEDHLAVGWDYPAEVVVDAPLDHVRKSTPRAIGRLEEIDATHTRLTGSTSNPTWYAEQLALIPAAYRVIGGREVHAATRALGERLLAATAEAVADGQ